MSNIGHHAPNQKITTCTLHQRMAVYDRLPRVVRDMYKDVPCKMECVGADVYCEAHGSAAYPVIIKTVRELSKKAYDACYLDVFGEVP